MISGFREIEHTADWAIEVWGTDLADLIMQSARGMNTLMGIQSRESEEKQVEYLVSASESEAQLVGVLNEILYVMETEGLILDLQKVEIQSDQCKVLAIGRPIARVMKQIKAVTFHNLLITAISTGLRAEVVFDV